MPEYIPRANRPESLASEIIRTGSQPRVESSIIDAVKGIAMNEMSGRQEYKQQKLKREQEVADTDEAQISDLIEKGYLELDPEILKNLKPGESKRKAIKGWIDDPQGTRGGGGQGSKYTLNADEMLMKALESLRNAYDKAEDPNAPEYKIDRKNPPKIISVETEIGRIKTALEASGRSIETLYKELPKAEYADALKKHGETAKAVQGATPTPKPPAPKASEQEAGWITALKAAKTKGGLSIYDAIVNQNSTEQTAKNAIKANIQGITDEQAIALAKKLKGK